MNKRIDWTQIINDILNSDKHVTCTCLAKKLGVDRTSVTRWRSYSIEPKYSKGKQLIEIWLNTANKQEDIPHVRY